MFNGAVIFDYAKRQAIFVTHIGSLCIWLTGKRKTTLSS